MFHFNQLAIIGATASGKSALAIEMATAYNAIIFSIDSLAIYKDMNIVSAKPSKMEQAGILHLGIDLLEVPQQFSAAKVAYLYKDALKQAKQMNKSLIIVGGSSFYLKTLMTGLSQLPIFSNKVIYKAKQMMKNPSAVYKMLYAVDLKSLSLIKQNDHYRLEKLLLLYLQTSQKPTQYYKEHPPLPIIDNINIFELTCDRQRLKERIALRTKLMLNAGLIDEIAFLEGKYGRLHASMRAIGVIETLQFLDNKINKATLQNLITTHTAQLAKRQTTFNSTQFKKKDQGNKVYLASLISNLFIS